MRLISNYLQTPLMNEIQEFALFTEFLDCFEEATIEPREAAPLDLEQQKLLARIASGDSTQEDLDKALQMLCTNSSAMEFFAQQLKAN